MEKPESSELHALTVSCDENMRSLLAVADRADCCVKELLPVRDVRQLEDRFKQWAENLGALQRFKSPQSLDHRLRDSPEIKNVVLSTLHELDVSVQAGATIEVPAFLPSLHIIANDIASGERKNRKRSIANRIWAYFFKHTVVVASETEQLVSAINTGISSLFETSKFIRQLSIDNKRLHASKTKPSEIRADVMYVRERYPSLESKNPALVIRLGEANARRGQYFRDCRSHKERLPTQPAEGSLQPTSKKDFGVSDQRTGSAMSMQAIEYSPSVFAETEATKMDPELTTDDLTLEIATVASFATDVASFDEGQLPFPPVPPAALYGAPILCHLCCTYIYSKSPNTKYHWWSV